MSPFQNDNIILNITRHFIAESMVSKSSPIESLSSSPRAIASVLISVKPEVVLKNSTPKLVRTRYDKLKPM
ncbi:hypothetical protein BpHYR1_024640 [Brachionus plicatilis]|uniref:Uncharacterized protein n=1 Tax=Brachionus plicatilis TaxID=10195 RepID=A0A3M7SG84_BRAPC|nr:hypothetical protein BpHYR1_024640 [Brachionus plicatilis]